MIAKHQARRRKAGHGVGTDDFLTDLGEQLRTARPRRDLHPVLAVAVIAVLAVALLALVPRDRERAAAPSAANPRIGVLNGTLIPDYATRTVEGLRRAGYRVLPPLNSPDRTQPLTTVDATSPRFAKAAAALRRRLDAERGTPAAIAESDEVAQDADIVVVLGQSGGVTPLSDTLPRVSIVDGSTRPGYGEALAERLRLRGATVTSVRVRPEIFRTRIQALGQDPGPAAEAAADLGLSGAFAPGRAATGDANALVTLGSDIPGATALERAIGLRKVTCRAVTPLRRRVDPFGPTRRPTYVCSSPPDRVFDVQVLAKGSFIAHRRGGGKAIYGSGARP